MPTNDQMLNWASLFEDDPESPYSSVAPFQYQPDQTSNLSAGIPAVAPVPPESVASISDQSSDRSPASSQDAVKAAISQRYGFGPGLDATALNGAQNQANQNQLFSNLGQGLNTISHSIARGSNPPDQSFYQGLSQQANQPVQNILQGRKTSLEDISAQQQFQDNDPKSTKAAVLRNVLTKMSKENGTKLPDLSGMSVNDMNELMKPIELGAQLGTKRELAQSRIQAQQAMAGNKQGDKLTASADKALEELKKPKSTYAAAQNTSDVAEEINGLIDQAGSNPAAMAALPTKMSLFLSEGQRMHSQTIDAYRNPDGSIGGKLGQALQMAGSGTLDADNQKFLKDFVNKTASEAQKTADKVKSRAAEEFKSTHKQYPGWYTPKTATPASGTPTGAYSDADKEARYQKWKAAQNAQ